MTVKDLIAVTDYFTMFMTEKNTNTQAIFNSNNELVKSQMLNLKIADIFADGGVVAEIKFDKTFYHLNKHLFT